MNREIHYHDPPCLSSQDYEPTAMFDYFNFPEETAVNKYHLIRMARILGIETASVITTS